MNENFINKKILAYENLEKQKRKLCTEIIVEVIKHIGPISFIYYDCYFNDGEAPKPFIFTDFYEDKYRISTEYKDKYKIITEYKEQPNIPKEIKNFIIIENEDYRDSKIEHTYFIPNTNLYDLLNSEINTRDLIEKSLLQRCLDLYSNAHVVLYLDDYEDLHDFIIQDYLEY